MTVDKLFIIQMSTKERKQELSSNILGINAKMNRGVNYVPSIYSY